MGNELENSVMASIHLPSNMSEVEFSCWRGCSVRPQWVQTSRTSKELLTQVSSLFSQPDRSLNTKWNEVILMQMKLLLFKWSRDHQVFASLLKSDWSIQSLFCQSSSVQTKRGRVYFVPSLSLCLFSSCFFLPLSLSQTSVLQLRVSTTGTYRRSSERS